MPYEIPNIGSWVLNSLYIYIIRMDTLKTDEGGLSGINEINGGGNT